MKKPYRIGFIGDTHSAATCGGLWPTKWLPGDAPYTGVRYINDCFQHLLDTWPELDVLVLMGDLIDGKNRKSDGVGVFTTHIGKQVEGATIALRPLCQKAKRVVRVYGTPYHEEHHDGLGKLDSELRVARSRWVINLNLPHPDGKPRVLNIAHHPPGGAAIYMGTKLDRQILWQIIMSAMRKIPESRWIVRGHVHTMAQMSRFGRTAALNGCWKLQDGHAIKGNYEGWQPDIGGLLLRQDDEHPSGWSFIESTYDPPIGEDVLDFDELMEQPRRPALNLSTEDVGTTTAPRSRRRSNGKPKASRRTRAKA